MRTRISDPGDFHRERGSDLRERSVGVCEQPGCGAECVGAAERFETATDLGNAYGTEVGAGALEGVRGPFEGLRVAFVERFLQRRQQAGAVSDVLADYGGEQFAIAGVKVSQ